MQDNSNIVRKRDTRQYHCHFCNINISIRKTTKARCLMNPATDPEMPGQVLPSPHATADEYLAGILALARLSRLTVACKSADYPGTNLLTVARLTGIPGELALLFDEWQQDAGPDLAAALRACAEGAGGTAAVPGHAERPVLVILDRFEDHLALPANSARAEADGRTLCELANEAGTDIHFLILVAESAQALLQRYAARIPGIAEASLRLPPPVADASAPRSASTRRRSFGSLLERLNDRAVDAPAAHAISTEKAIEERATADALAPRAQESFAGSGAVNAWLDDEAADHSATAKAPATPQQDSDDITIPVGYAATQMGAEQTTAEQRLLTSSECDEPALPLNATASVAESAPSEPAAVTASTSIPLLPEARMAEIAEVAPPPERGKGGMRVGYLAIAGIAALAIAWIGFSRMPHDVDPAKPKAQPAVAQANAPKEKSAAPEPAPVATATAAAAVAPPATTVPQVTPIPAGSKPETAAPIAAAPIASSEAGTATAKPSALALYILVSSPQERERLRTVSETLSAQGIRTVAISAISRGPNVSDLRYFRREERDEALKVQQALLDAGIQVRRLALVEGYENRAPRRQFELWLTGNGAVPAPAKNAAGPARNR
jgi:hypothetical protein